MDTFKTNQRPPVLARQNGNLQSFRKRTTAKLQGESIHFRYFRSRMSSYSPHESQKIFFFSPLSHLTLFSTDIELTSRSKRPHQARASPQRGSRALSKATFKFSSPSPARCCTHRPETRVFQPCCKQGVCNTVETRVFHRRCNRGVADTLKHPCFSPSFKTPLLQRCEIGGDFTDEKVAGHSRTVRTQVCHATQNYLSLL